MKQALEHSILIFARGYIRILSLLLSEVAELVPDLYGLFENPKVESVVLAPGGRRCCTGCLAVLSQCSSMLILLFDESSEDRQVGKMIAISMLECRLDLFGLFSQSSGFQNRVTGFLKR